MKKFAAFLACAVLCPAVWGYEFRTGEVTRLEDIPQDQQQTDDNGDVLSLLSIKTDIPSLHFEPSWLGIYNIETSGIRCRNQLYPVAVNRIFPCPLQIFYSDKPEI